MPTYQLQDEDEEERRLLEEYLALDGELAGDIGDMTPAMAAPRAMEPSEPAQQLTSPPQQPHEPYSTYEAPPEASPVDKQWLWIAAALDMALNEGTGAPQYMAQLARPDTSRHENWERRNKAKNDASSRAAQDQRRMQGPGNDLARLRFEADENEKRRLRSLEGPEVEQWREAAITAGYVTPEQAAKMSIEQLRDFRPTMGQAVAQDRSFKNATAGREQSHSLAVKRQGLANELATGRITYQDFLQQQRAIDEGEAKAETAAAEAAPTSPKVVQDHSEKYGQEIRLRGLDTSDAAVSKVEEMLAKYEGRDIPGYGPVDGMLPDAMVSEEARAMRAAVRELQDTKLRAATGAAAPPSEQATFGAILGTGAFNTEGDLRRGVGQARQFVDTQKGYVNEMYPSSRQAGGVARPAPRKQRRAVPRGPEAMRGAPPAPTGETFDGGFL